MFKKLLKYDIKSISKLWWIGAIISVAAAIAGAILIRFFEYTIIEKDTENILLGLIAIFGLIAAMFCISAIFLAFIFTAVLVFVRFYKHFFTDEGYLTFTLPVKRSALFLSKTVNAAIWFAAHLVVIIISLLLFALLVVPPEENGFLINPIFFKDLGEFFGELWQNVGAWLIVYVLEAILAIFTYSIFSISLVHFCITIGSVLVKKAKLILSIGIYYAFSSSLAAICQFGIYLFGSLMSTGMLILMENATANQIHTAIIFLILAVIAIIATITAVLYSITQYMLDRKLNLA